jgi:hypothetical protein
MGLLLIEILDVTDMAWRVNTAKVADVYSADRVSLATSKGITTKMRRCLA